LNNHDRPSVSRSVGAGRSAHRISPWAITSRLFRGHGLRPGRQTIPIEHAFEWLNAFDIDEIRTFLAEAHAAFRRAADAEISWDDFEAVLHEWHESAKAIRSDALAAAFSAPSEEVPLTQPSLTATGCSTDV
jgi:hypothetical protein